MTDAVVRGLNEAIAENHRLCQSLQRAEEDLGKEIEQIDMELKDANRRIVILNNDYDSLCEDLTTHSNEMKQTESSLQHLIFTSKNMDVSIEDSQKELEQEQLQLTAIQQENVDESHNYHERVKEMQIGLENAMTVLQGSSEVQDAVSMSTAMLTDEGQ